MAWRRAPMARRRLTSVVIAAAMLAGCAPHSGGPSLAVGAAADRQNTLLATIYAAGLRYYGTDARVEVSEDPLEALDDGTVSVAAGFTGRLLRRFVPDSAARAPESVYRAMIGALPEGLAAADYAVAAEDKPALAVTETTATAWGGRDLEAALRRCAMLVLGAATGSWTPGVVGACDLPAPREFGTPAMLFDALRAGSVNAAWTSTAAAEVPDGVVVLADGSPALIPADNVVALFRRNELNPMQLRAVNEIAGVLDTASLTDMQRKVAAGADPRAVAEEWLAANPLGR